MQQEIKIRNFKNYQFPLMGKRETHKYMSIHNLPVDHDGGIIQNVKGCLQS